jgi:hypothetical protein
MTSRYETAADYHRDTSRISASMLKVFRRSRCEYHARYVAETLPDTGGTSRLDLGTACHLAVFEPDRWHQAVAVAPDVDRRTKAGKEAFAAFEADAGDRLVLTAAAAATAVAVAASVRAVPLVRQLLDVEGVAEEPVLWTDATGLDCKAKPDRIMPSIGTILDLKTVSDTSPWAIQRQIPTMGYEIQARHYLAGTGATRFVWITVGIEPPFEVGLWELDEDGHHRAETRYRDTMHQLVACYRTGRWDLVPEEVVRVPLPAWV